MIQRVIDNLSTINQPKRFIFILRDEDCSRYHTDNTVRLLAGGTACSTPRAAPAARCSRVDHIGNDQPLLIVNGDQMFDTSLDTMLAQFGTHGSDAGCFTFSRCTRAGPMCGSKAATPSSRPPRSTISRHAIAGLYYFARGADFVTAAKLSISKDASIDGVYRVAPVLNELILLVSA
jgi:hypothetical protein